MRVFIYARVSKDDRGEREQNPEAQLIPMREYCAKKEWQICGEFVDRQSGGDIYRPEFKRMMESIARKECDIVMVWKLDRLSRFEPMAAVVMLYYITNEYQTEFVSLQDPDASTLDNPLPKLLRLPMLALKLAFAAMERESISARTKAGIAAKKAVGQYSGGRPLGSQDKEQRKGWGPRKDISVQELFKPTT